jgi:hypothetical protein
MDLRSRVVTLAILPLGIVLSGCSSRHVFHVESSHAAPAHAAPRAHAKKQHPTQTTGKAKAPRPANDATASTWAGELD